jgi:hypothetical protein
MTKVRVPEPLSSNIKALIEKLHLGACLNENPILIDGCTDFILDDTYPVDWN